jgi:hypothetical protein
MQPDMWWEMGTNEPIFCLLSFSLYEFSHPFEPPVEAHTSFYVGIWLKRLPGWVGHWTPGGKHHCLTPGHHRMTTPGTITFDTLSACNVCCGLVRIARRGEHQYAF